MRTVAIAGVGLIGGSFALALRKAGFTGTLLGVSSPATIQTALDRQVIDRGVTLAEAALEADLIVLAQPILRIVDALAALGPLVRAGTLVTDVGSTKQQIVAAAARAGIPFLGGHPMAGKESRGVESADPELFQGRPWILTPAFEDGRTAEFESWLGQIGARILKLTPQDHDRLVALSSHLPQLLSTGLAASLERTDAAMTAGPGLHDMTRLALSSPDLWSDILQTNREAVSNALHLCIARLEQMRQALLSGADLEEEFHRGRRFAERLRGKADAIENPQRE